MQIDLPNPLGIVTYQSLVDKVWRASRDGRIPLFYTYSHDQHLYLILARDCGRRASYAGALTTYLSQFEDLRGTAVATTEARDGKNVLSSIQ